MLKEPNLKQTDRRVVRDKTSKQAASATSAATTWKQAGAVEESIEAGTFGGTETRQALGKWCSTSAHEPFKTGCTYLVHPGTTQQLTPAHTLLGILDFCLTRTTTQRGSYA